ncbi:MAG: S41 family peptidase [Bryobacteraceae bacterium]
MRFLTLVASLGALCALAGAESRPGYYRYPALSGGTTVFTAEGDLWSVPAAGGTARRLTTSPGEERAAAISPDGRTIAFVAEYEGPDEVYSMPIEGGLPTRRTWDGSAGVAGWTPDGRLLYRTRRFSTLPSVQLVALDLKGGREVIELAQAAEAAFLADGKTIVFTRLPFQGSSTKRYKGGEVQSLWRWTPGTEAVPLTRDYPGTSKNPMFWKGRVYFLSDRDGVMNVWSMTPDGKDPRQHTHHKDFDAQTASLADGRIAYQCGADIWLLDLKSGRDAVVPITLVSDFDQLRERWVKKPMQYLSSGHLAPDGSGMVFTARGEVFVAPAKPGRLVRVARQPGVRFRDARYSADGKSIVVMSTASGETELWRYPANGVGPGEQLTNDAKVLRWDGVSSPDGAWLAHTNKDQQLWLLNLKTKENKKIAESSHDGFDDLKWSSDSKWLAYVETAADQFREIKVYNVDTGAITALTSDRFNSGSPAWSADGQWLYFLSDRNLKTTVHGPWGTRQPDPHFDRTMKIYQLALKKGLRSPFEPPDELHPEAKPEEKKEETKPATETKPADAKDKPADKAAADKDKSADKDKDKPVEKGKEAVKVKVEIELDGIMGRISEAPAPPGNYEDLSASAKRLCWMAEAETMPPQQALTCMDIDNKGEKPETVMADVRGYELSQDGKKLAVRKEQDFYIFDAGVKAAALGTPKALADAKVDLSGWSFELDPKADFKEMFADAWRLERDYFYDRNMHGLDWKAVRAKYEPLVDRVTEREELNDLLAQMVGELSALHIFVGGGDIRETPDPVSMGALGALLERDDKAGGVVVKHIYRHDPDLPDQASPLARPGVDVREGDVITMIDGAEVPAAPDIGALLREKANRQTLVRVKQATDGKTRDVLVKPMTTGEEASLRYGEWELERRHRVEQAGGGKIGYLHLRAMGSGDMERWERDYYPVFDRQGLIIDVRHNNGGNIDSWLLGKLLRKAWFYWQPRVGDPTWNMQYAFRGHMVVLVDESTASDGEAFAEGFRRLGLGKVIGVRTWGGEIWLSASNVLVDRGIATAAETGVYGPERKWLIEGYGVEPDIVVDNLPHETFSGRDAQLEAALKHLQELIQKDPRTLPAAPPYPDKAVQ